MPGASLKFRDGTLYMPGNKAGSLKRFGSGLRNAQAPFEDVFWKLECFRMVPCLGQQQTPRTQKPRIRPLRNWLGGWLGWIPDPEHPGFMGALLLDNGSSLKLIGAAHTAGGWVR